MVEWIERSNLHQPLSPNGLRRRVSLEDFLSYEKKELIQYYENQIRLFGLLAKVSIIIFPFCFFFVSLHLFLFPVMIFVLLYFFRKYYFLRCKCDSTLFLVCSCARHRRFYTFTYLNSTETRRSCSECPSKLSSVFHGEFLHSER